MEKLSRRIKALPSELSDLYREMWNRLDDDDKHLYQADTAVYFKIALGYSPSLFRMLLITRPDVLRAFLSGGAEVTEQYIARELRNTRQRIHSKCSGLLEVKFSEDNIEQLCTEDNIISFIHRSARDFLCDTVEGRRILSYDTRTKAELFHPSVTNLLVSTDFLHHWPDTMRGICLSMLLRVFFGGKLRDKDQLELPLLDLVSSYLNRHSVWANEYISFAYFAAVAGSVSYVRKLLLSLSSHHPSYISAYKSELLSYAIESIRYTNIADNGMETWKRCGGLISWLLREGADPNYTRLRTSRLLYRARCQCTFGLFLINAFEYLRVDRKDSHRDFIWESILKLIFEFLEHGANVDAHMIRIMNKFNADAISFYNRPHLGYGHSILILDMSVSEMLRVVGIRLMDWVEILDESMEWKQRLRHLFEGKRTKLPKAVLFGVECLRAQGTYYRQFIPVDRSISLEFSKNSNQDWMMESVAFLEDHLDLTMDSKGAVKWLVDKGYLAEEAVLSENPGRILGLDDRGFDYAGKEENEYAPPVIDWSYRPEYGNFVKAVEEFFSSGDSSSGA